MVNKIHPQHKLPSTQGNATPKWFNSWRNLKLPFRMPKLENSPLFIGQDKSGRTNGTNVLLPIPISPFRSFMARLWADFNMNRDKFAAIMCFQAIFEYRIQSIKPV